MSGSVSVLLAKTIITTHHTTTLQILTITGTATLLTLHVFTTLTVTVSVCHPIRPTLLSVVGIISKVAVSESKKAAPGGRSMARKTSPHVTRKTSLPRMAASSGTGSRPCRARPEARQPMNTLSARGSRMPPHTLCVGTEGEKGRGEGKEGRRGREGQHT